MDSAVKYELVTLISKDSSKIQHNVFQISIEGISKEKLAYLKTVYKGVILGNHIYIIPCEENLYLSWCSHTNKYEPFVTSNKYPDCDTCEDKSRQIIGLNNQCLVIALKSVLQEKYKCLSSDPSAIMDYCRKHGLIELKYVLDIEYKDCGGVIVTNSFLDCKKFLLQPQSDDMLVYNSDEGIKYLMNQNKDLHKEIIDLRSEVEGLKESLNYIIDLLEKKDE